MKKFRLPQEPIRLQDLLNCAWCHSFSYLYRPTSEFVIELAYVLSTILTSPENLMSEQASNSGNRMWSIYEIIFTQIMVVYTKKDVLKNRLISNYFLLFAPSSPVEFIVFSVWNFVQSLNLYYKKIFCQFNWVTKRGNLLRLLYRNSLKYSNDQRGKLDWNWLILYLKLNCMARETLHYVPLHATTRRATNELSQLQNTQLNLLMYSDFHCHLKVNRD